VFQKGYFKCCTKFLIFFQFEERKLFSQGGQKSTQKKKDLKETKASKNKNNYHMGKNILIKENFWMIFARSLFSFCLRIFFKLEVLNLFSFLSIFA